MRAALGVMNRRRDEGSAAANKSPLLKCDRPTWRSSQAPIVVLGHPERAFFFALATAIVNMSRITHSRWSKALGVRTRPDERSDGRVPAPLGMWESRVLQRDFHGAVDLGL